MVIERTRGAIRVLKSQYLPRAIRSPGEQVLNADQINLISLQLDLVCRDVQD